MKGVKLLVPIEPSDQFVYRKENDEFFEGVLKETFKCIMTMLAQGHTYLLDMNIFFSEGIIVSIFITWNKTLKQNLWKLNPKDAKPLLP